MKNIIRKYWLSIILGVLLVALFVEYQRIKNRYEHLKRHNVSQEERIYYYQDEIDDLESRNTELEDENEELKDELDY